MSRKLREKELPHGKGSKGEKVLRERDKNRGNLRKAGFKWCGK